VGSANLDLVRSLYADWERGDYSSAHWAHPAIEFVIVDGPTAGSCKGVVAMVEAWREFVSTWEEYHLEVDEYRELDAERILVLMLHCGRRKTGGPELGQTGAKRGGANVLHIRDGKVTRLALYWDRERVFTDLGLSLETGSPRS
jgi:hypothetical protein